MADTWWFEETKVLIALWSEEAVQHQLNTMNNKKLVWDKLSQGMADGENCLIRCCCFRRGSVLLLAFGASFAFLLASKSSIVVNIMAAVIGRHFEATMPSLFEFSQM